jgi:hypothetical protein
MSSPTRHTLSFPEALPHRYSKPLPVTLALDNYRWKRKRMSSDVSCASASFELSSVPLTISCFFSWS